MSYATLTDLATYGLPSAALGSISDGDKTAALAAASDFADGYMRSRLTVPLTSWGVSLTMAVCKIATFTLMERRGFRPENGADAMIKDGYNRSVAWLTQISRGEVTIATAQPVDSPTYDNPRVDSLTPRGFDNLRGT